MNVGIAFATPEQVFFDSTNPLHCDLPTPSFDIKTYFGREEPDPKLFTELCGSPEIVLLVAPAASGKSTLSQKFSNHFRCNSDDLGGFEKCMATAKTALMATEQKSVIIDNTNIFPEARQKWIELAKDLEGKSLILRLPSILILYNVLNVPHTVKFSSLFYSTNTCDLY